MKKEGENNSKESFKLEGVEKSTLKRIKDSRKKKAEESKNKKEKQKDKDEYAKISSSFFSKSARKLSKGDMFQTLEKELIKANLRYTPNGYISIILFTTFLAFIISILLTLFFLYLKIEATPPFVTGVEESFIARLPKVVWMIVFFPVATFLFSYFYPTLEKKSVADKIEQELPFATIHMASISGSMIDPSKIFEIIITTKEYPYLEKEFKKLMNEINIYGYDFVSALRNSASYSPSKTLSDLFNSLATTINSGGDLPEFFGKRADSLMFQHKIEKEKATKAAETFMDIYISIVIAAPMVLMLLLMMMKISGLGLSLSTGMITLIMVLGVTIINIVFMIFLHLRKK